MKILQKIIKFYNKNIGFYKSSKHRIKYLKNIYSEFNDEKIDSYEEEHIKKWSIFKYNISPFYFRLYSYLSGIKNIDFAPDDIYSYIVLPRLNPYYYSFVFADKNYSDLIFYNINKPNTILRLIKNCFLDKEYNKIHDINKYLKKINNDVVIVKPTRETTGGKNIRVFKRKDGDFKDDKNNILNEKFLIQTYKNNLIIQEFVEQHEFLRNFNKKSLNTFRVIVYRSFEDEIAKIVSVSLRIGGDNSYIDNLNGGGFVIGINKNGTLYQYAINLKGEKLNYINKINLKENIILPFYEDICEFSKIIANTNPFQRFLGLDITIDSRGKPLIIEVNNGFIGNDLPHLLGISVFGEYCDEIIFHTHKM